VVPLDAIANTLIALCGEDPCKPAEPLPATAIYKFGE